MAKQLIKPNEQQRSLAQTLKIGILQSEPTINGKITFINQIGASIFGYNTAEEVINKKLISFFANPDEYRHFFCNLEKKCIDFALEALCERKDKKLLMILMTASLVEDNDGRNIRTDWTIRDIQKNKEEELEKEILGNINKILISNLNIKKVYHKICHELNRKIKWDRVSITLCDQEGTGAVNFLVTKGKEKSNIEEILGEKECYPLVGSILENVILSRKPVITSDTRKNLTKTDTLFVNEGLLSRLAYPLKYKDKIIGSINFSCKCLDFYNEEHLNLLEKVAPYLSMAIENTKLFVKATESEEKYDELFKTVDNPFNVIW